MSDLCWLLSKGQTTLGGLKAYLSCSAGARQHPSCWLVSKFFPLLSLRDVARHQPFHDRACGHTLEALSA